MSRELVNACKRGELDEVKRLIGCGADVHYDNDWSLRRACAKGHLELVKYLVGECGADIHVLDDWPLRRAKLNGHPEMVQWIENYDLLKDLRSL